MLRYSLTKACRDDYREWESQLPGILYGLRCRQSPEKRSSPYRIVFGVAPKLPTDHEKEPVEVVSLAAREDEISSLPFDRRSLEREQRSSTRIQNFKIGEIVLALKEVLKKGNKIDKKNPRYEEPY
ncbi:hypothetical protein AYI69_g2300 [Smittium culicis]|uniref:Uncharacterized protein n=1 Tax=Smittium culicis TaxID=133412 RepID=A0A1R1YMV5_9FUNG|nr:hypothetical protein AYI69_g2300 [Smittium culicis]